MTRSPSRVPVPILLLLMAGSACDLAPPPGDGVDAACPVGSGGASCQPVALPLSDIAHHRRPDGRPCRRRSDCASGICTAFFRDADADGRGVSAATLLCGSRPPAGFVLVSGDCCDVDARVHPGQLGFFTLPTACGGFDYDCSGVAQRWRTSIEECTQDACISGWRLGVPPCGAAGSYMDCRRIGPLPSCDVIAVSQRVQGCR